MATEFNYVAYKRVPWGGNTGEVSIVRYGVDWSLATFKMDIRASKGDTGTALVSLANASAGSQGISATYDSDAVHPVSGQVVGATTIIPQINEATLEALTEASPADADLVRYYDLHVTPSGEGKRVLIHGTFTIKPGVTV